MVQCEVGESGLGLELKISGDADVANALSLQEQIASAIIVGRDVIVDLDGVTRLDGAGVQLLVALQTFVAGGGAVMTVIARTDIPMRALEMAAALAVLRPNESPRVSAAQ